VRSGSTDSNFGGTITSDTRIGVLGNYNNNIVYYGVALVLVCISFIVSIYNEMCITYCCYNQLCIKLLHCKVQFF